MPGLYTGAQGLFGGFPGLLYGTALSTPPSLLADAQFGSNTPAGALLNTALSGFAVDFLSSPANLLTRSYPGNNLMNYSGTPFQVSGGPINFTRGSLATVTDSDGLIKWAPHNLLLASEQFDASNWSKTEATVTANTVAAPNGTSTADTIAENTANDVHALSQSVGTLTAENYTYSVFLKYNNLQYVTISFNQSSVSTAWASAIFDIQNGTLASSNASGGPSIIGTPTISPIGSGWYLCSVTANLGSAVGGQVYLASANTSSGASFRGAQVYTGSSRLFYAWGAHLYRSDLGGMQANASAYPYYNPSTPKNLLGYTELLTTGWTNTDTTDSQVAVAAPNGSANSIEVTATAGNGTLLASLSLLASPYTFSVWLKRKTGTGTVEITVDGTTYVTAAVTSEWQRFSTTLTPSAGTKTPGIRLVTSGDAVYAWGAQLSDSASLDPYSPVFGPAPSAAAYHGPRLDYDPVTLSAKGLLVEEGRTNLARYSEASASTLGDASGTTPPTIAATTLSGVSVEAITFTTGGSGYSFSRRGGIASPTTSGSWTATSGTTYTASCYVALSRALTGTEAITIYQTGAFGAYSITLNSATTNPTALQRYSATAAATASGTMGTHVYIGSALSSDVTVYITRFQVEAGSFATSYIPTDASTVTRNADVASVATSQFPYSASEGTLVAAFDFLGYKTNTVMTVVSAGTDNSNLIRLFQFSSSNVQSGAQLGYSSIVSGLFQADQNIKSAPAVGTVYKSAAAFKANDFAGCADGGTVLIDTSGAMPSATTFGVGMSPAKTNQLNGHLRQITYIPRRLTNAELQSRTA